MAQKHTHARTRTRTHTHTHTHEQELPYGTSVDWWSLGVLSYELLQGEPPFDGDDEEEMFDSILNHTVEFDTAISPTARSYVMALLERDASKRLGCGTSGKEDFQRHPVGDSVCVCEREAQAHPPPPTRTHAHTHTHAHTYIQMCPLVFVAAAVFRGH